MEPAEAEFVKVEVGEEAPAGFSIKKGCESKAVSLLLLPEYSVRKKDSEIVRSMRVSTV